MQSLVTYSVLTKNKCVLDQMRKGLATLNILPHIEKHPDLFEQLFVDKVGNVTSDFVKNLLQLPGEDSSSALKRSIQMLLSFLDNAEVSDLKDFLRRLGTGSCSVTSKMASGCIRVSCVDTESFSASTCLPELKIPTNF